MKRTLIAALVAFALCGGAQSALAQNPPPPPPGPDAPPPPPGPDAPPPAGGPSTGGDSSAPAPKPSKATLAVLPFNFTAEVRNTHDETTVTFVKEFETKTLTNKFITELVNSRKFDVIEREKLDKLMQEMQFGESGMVDKDNAVKAGKVLGVDYFLMGQISIFSVTQSFKEVPYVNKYKRTVRAEIIVDMRIVDTRTSKIVAAEKGEAVQEFSAVIDQPRAVDVPPRMLDDLQRDLCHTLTLRVIDAIYPIKVIGYTGGVAFLNRGEGGGLAVGDVLDVFVTGEEMVDPDTGAVLGSTESKIGQIRVTQVLPKFTKAVPHGTAIAAIPKEAICRKAIAVAPTKPADAPKKGPKGW